MKNSSKFALLFSIFVVLLFSTTDAFAVIGHPPLDKPALSKQEKRKFKRQQKVLDFFARMQRKKLGKHKPFSSNPPCDTIVLNNGDKIAAMLFDRDRRRVQYARCNQVSLRKARILRILIKEIRYQNGEVESFEEPEIAPEPAPIEDLTPINATPEEIKKAKRLGILFGSLFGVLGVFGLVSLLMGFSMLGVCMVISPLGMLALGLEFRKQEKAIRYAIIHNAWLAFGITTGIFAILLIIALISLLMNFSLDISIGGFLIF